MVGEAAKTKPMLLRLSISTVRRSTGRSACAASAYRTGATLRDVRQGRVFRYPRRADRIAFTALVGWSGKREDLWNAAEQSERRKDSVTARECLLTLFSELTPAENTELAMSYARWLNGRLGVAVDVAIHNDAIGPHAHLLFTVRSVSPLGEFGGRTLLDDRFNRGPEAIRQMRSHWRELANEALERAGEPRVDCPGAVLRDAESSAVEWSVLSVDSDVPGFDADQRRC